MATKAAKKIDKKKAAEIVLAAVSVKNTTRRKSNNPKGNPDKIKDFAWKPGQSGNPAGRPKKPITLLSEAIRAKLQESYADGKTYAEAIADRLCKEAIKHETQFVATSSLIADRTEGKPTQPVDMNINQPFANKTNAEIAAYIANGVWPEEAK